MRAFISAILSMLSFVTRVCATTGKIIVETVVTAAAVPGAIVGSLFGGGTIPHAPGDDRETANDVEQALDNLSARRQALSESGLWMRHSDTLGDVVHAYASGNDNERLEMDLDVLPHHVRAWLLTRREDELLRKLSAAGVVACGRIVDGQRSGFIGMQTPEAVDEQDAEQAELVRAKEAMFSSLYAVADMPKYVN